MFPGTQFTAKQRAVNKWDTLGFASRVLSLAALHLERSDFSILNRRNHTLQLVDHQE
jgi:hypothetical protein